jgi:hypothetical protein
MVFIEDFGLPPWKNPSKIYAYKWFLLKIKEI